MLYNICVVYNIISLRRVDISTLQVIIWDPQHLQSLHTLPTLGGFAYSLAISPLDPGTLGVGVGDNMLRIWQTASSAGPYEALVLWQGIKSKVMVVSKLKGLLSCIFDLI